MFQRAAAAGSASHATGACHLPVGACAKQSILLLTRLVAQLLQQVRAMLDWRCIGLLNKLAQLQDCLQRGAEGVSSVQVCSSDAPADDRGVAGLPPGCPKAPY